MPEKPPKMAKKNKKGYLLINLEATKLTFGALIMQIHVGSNSYFLKIKYIFDLVYSKITEKFTFEFGRWIFGL